MNSQQQTKIDDVGGTRFTSDIGIGAAVGAESVLPQATWRRALLWGVPWARQSALF